MANDVIMDRMRSAMKNNGYVRLGENDHNTGIYGPILRKPGGHIAALPVDGRSCAFVQNLPEGKNCLNEFGAAWWYSGAQMDYHDHQWGYKALMVTSGKVEAYFNHQRCMLEPGDLCFIKPHVAHAFINQETEKDQGVTWMELYDGMRMYYGMEAGVKLEKNYPGLKQDDAYQTRQMNTLGTFYCQEPPKADLADKREVPWVRPPESAIRTFENKAGKFMLKIGRWEYDGLKEVWEMRPNKGLRLDFKIPFADYPLYYVLEGKMIVECNGETYVGEKADFLHIPPWRQFSISFPEEGARILVCNEQSELFQILETLKSMAKTAPDDLQDWDDKVVPVLRRYNNWLTGVSGI